MPELPPHRHNHEHDHDHDHAHDREHGGADHAHSHGHSHAPASFGRAFAVGIALNSAFIATEVIFGLRSNSVSLLADAGHNLSDVFGLVIAWGATALAKAPPSTRFTYGL